MSDSLVDRVTGALGLLLASVYLVFTRGIEDSMLADAVGAAGVPTGVGVVLFLASLLLFIKSWKSSAIQAEAKLDKSEEVVEGFEHPHRQAAILLAILIAYVAVLPLLGYVLAIGLLVGSVAWFGGARKLQTIGVCMLVAGPFLWFLFDWLLEIHMPVGLWAQWFKG
jgi:putative tricarboxylic transport membrane protein